VHAAKRRRKGEKLAFSKKRRVEPFGKPRSFASAPDIARRTDAGAEALGQR